METKQKNNDERTETIAICHFLRRFFILFSRSVSIPRSPSLSVCLCPFLCLTRKPITFALSVRWFRGAESRKGFLCSDVAVCCAPQSTKLHAELMEIVIKYQWQLTDWLGQSVVPQTGTKHVHRTLISNNARGTARWNHSIHKSFIKVIFRDNFDIILSLELDLWSWRRENVVTAAKRTDGSGLPQMTISFHSSILFN